MKCLFCGELIPPGSRAYLKTREEEVKHVIGILKDKYLFSQSEDNFTKFLKDGVMCRKKCLNILSKLVKLKKEIEALESDVVEKFGDVIVSNGFGSLHGEPCTQ